ncbi:MAG: hypothetical protein RL198_743 [Actinomycetota bacterium]
MLTAFWFRRDRRLADNPSLNAAAATAAGLGTGLLGVYVVDPALTHATPLQQASILESLRSLNATMADKLLVQTGEASQVWADLARRLQILKVFATRAFDPEGMAVQDRVKTALQQVGVELSLQDSYYAVPPGTVSKPDGSAVKVYTPFYKRWLEQGFAPPEKPNFQPDIWIDSELPGAWPSVSGPTPFHVRAGEEYAWSTWRAFAKRALTDYADNRNRPDISGTSKLSHALAHGEIHPRSLLAELSAGSGQEVFRKELAWREFYADVLFRNPSTLDDYYDPRFKRMRYDSGPVAEQRFEAWTAGRTGYPMVDAAMRQLRETGWMHNRCRMLVASFLVKDLHIEWQRGAEHFEKHLTDYDPASNSHGWQWTAGCGTDASPYYRVFNPVLQGLKFDPQGEYVRKFIPELRHVSGPEVHQPWILLDGASAGYPDPIVDHAVERDEALARLEELKQQA